MTKKIALIGSAPSSVRRAPYDDPSWTVWGCSPGALGFARKIDAWFELHSWRTENPCCEINYVKRLKELTCPIYMVNQVPELPQSVPYPKEDVLNYSYGKIIDLDGNERPARFNANDFGSSLSWMFAMAIMQRPEVIGLWGVDMAAGEEYGPQKDGCLALMHIAKSVGITIILPPESDLIRPTPLYGYQEHDHMWVKLNERLKEIIARLNDVAQKRQAAHDEYNFLSGAKDDIEYFMKTWVCDSQALQMAYSQPQPVTHQIAASIIEETVTVQKAIKSKPKRVPKLNGKAHEVQVNA